MYKDTCQRGFTLVEVLVTLVIVSVAVLSLGGFSLSVVGSGQLDRERLTAIHLAEQTIEFWQQDPDQNAPQVSSGCNFSAGGVPTYPFSTVCTPTSGMAISYTIHMDEIRATAPLPSNPNGNDSNNGALAVRAMLGAAASQPDLKAVMVTWSHKGKSHSVALTALVVPQ
ncbi:MAG: prepilin-type N-terminal cleavage/methylation domain-containing protein [Mariprofundus sp.]|nr:prepilin-type N-terminal cleavage/methylation domain-containing protein [Mariprofundus sp.]